MNALERRSENGYLKSLIVARWKTIAQFTHDVVELNPGEALNIVGFYDYPLGWTWREIIANKEYEYRPYKTRLPRRDANVIGPPFELSWHSGTAGEVFRAERARITLVTALATERVRLFATDIYNVRWQVGLDDIRSEFFGFDVRNHTLRLAGTPQYAGIDGAQLIAFLESRSVEWNKKRTKHDWVQSKLVLGI